MKRTHPLAWALSASVTTESCCIGNARSGSPVPTHPLRPEVSDLANKVTDKQPINASCRYILTISCVYLHEKNNLLFIWNANLTEGSVLYLATLSKRHKLKKKKRERHKLSHPHNSIVNWLLLLLLSLLLVSPFYWRGYWSLARFSN